MSLPQKNALERTLYVTVFGCGTEREVVKLYEWSPQDCSANCRALQAVSSGLRFLRPSLTLVFHRGLMKQEDFDVRLPELKSCEKLSFFSLWLAQLECSVTAIRVVCWLVWVLLRVSGHALSHTPLMPCCLRHSLACRCSLFFTSSLLAFFSYVCPFVQGFPLYWTLGHRNDLFFTWSPAQVPISMSHSLVLGVKSWTLL